MRSIVAVTCFAAFCAIATLAQDQSASPASSTPAQPSQNAPKLLRIGGNVMQASLIKQVTPLYPADAKAAGVAGTVVLHVIVGTDGKIEDVKLISGPPLLTQAAIDAVAHWEYRPTLLNGEPVRVDTTISVVFTLGHIRQPASSGSSVSNSTAPASPSGSDSAGDTTPHDVVAAKLIHMVKPKYPKDAKKAGITGTVVLHAMIGTDGHVRDLTYVSGPEQLKEAALDAVAKWVYAPTYVNGEPKEVNTTISVAFTL